jgi:hypothetical protein
MLYTWQDRSNKLLPMLSVSAMQKDVPGDPAVSSTPLETPLHMRLYTELPNLQKLPLPFTPKAVDSGTSPP